MGTATARAVPVVDVESAREVERGQEDLGVPRKRVVLSPRRERRRKRTRDAIREAARAVLERKGYAQTTLRDIIDESDITHPTFYKYFESKEEVLSDLIDGLVDDLVATALPFGFERVRNLRDSFRLGFRALFEVARRNRQLLRAIREAIHSSPRHAERWDRFRSRSLAMVERGLGWAERAGLVDCPDRSILAVAMVATTEAALFELAAREDHDPSAVEDVLESFYWNAVFGWRGGLVDYVVTPGKKPRPVYSPGQGRTSRVGRATSRRPARRSR